MSNKRKTLHDQQGNKTSSAPAQPAETITQGERADTGPVPDGNQKPPEGWPSKDVGNEGASGVSSDGAGGPAGGGGTEFNGATDIAVNKIGGANPEGAVAYGDPKGSIAPVKYEKDSATPERSREVTAPCGLIAHLDHVMDTVEKRSPEWNDLLGAKMALTDAMAILTKHEGLLVPDFRLTLSTVKTLLL